MTGVPHSERWQTQPLDYRGLRVTVMGLGAFGGGEGAARFLASHGAAVTVTDRKSADALRPAVERLADAEGIRFHLGGHIPDDFADIDLLVVNPAVPRDNPYLRMAVDARVPLTSEMNLFWLHQRGRVVGITGSNGKSTTTALTHAMLQSGGIGCRLGGNIGRSLLAEIDVIDSSEWVVLELSSFQLADLDHVQRSPDIAVVTNFSPNHLDRHGTLDEYRSAKQTILRWQSAESLAILNGDDRDVAGWPVAGRRLLFGTTAAEARVAAGLQGSDVVATLDEHTCVVSLRNNPHLPGRHNAQNVAAAALAALACGAEPAAVEEAVRTFPGLPHRLQFVAEVAGRLFYNDSKATTPEAALAALAAFHRHQRLVLLAGGSDKGVDLSPLSAAIARRVSAAALLGETARTIELGVLSRTSMPPRLACPPSFPVAFAWAVEQSRPGDVVLLSPGCASYDWFSSYEDRGEQFVSLVRQWSSH